MAKFKDKIDHFITREDFEGIKETLGILENSIRRNALAKKIGIGEGSLRSILTSEGGEKISTEKVLVPCLRYIYENSEWILERLQGHDHNSFVSKIHEEHLNEGKSEPIEELLLEKFYGIDSGDFSTDHSICTNYIGYRISSEYTDENPMIIRFYHSIHKPDNGTLSTFTNFLTNSDYVGRRTRGHVFSIENRIFMSGISVVLGSNEPLMRKSFTLQLIGGSRQRLTGVVSTRSANDNQIVCRTFLLPVDQHTGIKLARLDNPAFTAKDPDNIDLQIEGNEKLVSLKEFTGKFELSEIEKYLPSNVNLMGRISNENSTPVFPIRR